METTESSLAISKRLIELQSPVPSIIYPLMLRLRAVYYADTLIDGKQHSTKGFVELVMGHGFSRKQVLELVAVFRQMRDRKPALMASIGYPDLERLYRAVEASYYKLRVKWEKLA